MAQVYTFGYQQRHPEWAGDPWTEYTEPCQRDFGTPMPTFAQMLRSNPRATVEHMRWNLKLLPSGLQLLLFDVHSGSFSPDYQRITPDPAPANCYSTAAGVLVVMGLLLAWRRRRWWWDNWFRSRAAGWAAMLAIVAVASLVVPTERPRPSYLFGVGVILMALVATCGFVVLATIFRRRPGAGRLAERFMPIGMLILPAVIHSPYAAGTPELARRSQMAYHELLPFENSIKQGRGILLEEAFADAFKNYLGEGKGSFLGYSTLQERKPGEKLPAFLNREGVSFFRVNEACWAQLEADEPGCVRDLIDNGASTGWWLVAFEDTQWRWLLFRRAPVGPAASVAPPWRATSTAKGFFPPPAAALFSGLRPVSGLGSAELVGVQFDPKVVRCGLWPGTRLVPRNPAPGKYRLIVKGVAAAEGQLITVLLDGQLVGRCEWPGITSDDVHAMTVPLDLSAGDHEILLRYAVSARYDRAVLFQELRLLSDLE